VEWDARGKGVGCVTSTPSWETETIPLYCCSILVAMATLSGGSRVPEVTRVV